MVYRSLADKYGWISEQVDNLTLYQALIYLGGIVPEDGKTVTITERQPTARQLRANHGI